MRKNTARLYVGIENDTYGGMTPTGNIIRDAWVFGLLEETETCTGWGVNRIQDLYDQVSQAWAPYGHLVSSLPAELAERHRRIYEQAVNRARELGWTPDISEDD